MKRDHHCKQQPSLKPLFASDTFHSPPRKSMTKAAHCKKRLLQATLHQKNYEKEPLLKATLTNDNTHGKGK